MSRLIAFAALISAIFMLSACGSSDKKSSSDSKAPQPKAAVPGFKSMKDDQLTVGTELPNPPFVNAKSIDGIKDDGYEVEMVNALAKELGFAKVKWVNFPFNGLVAGAKCPCDFAVNGVSIFPDREEKVDFSAPYFTANQGVLVKKGTPVPASLEQGKGLQYGVQKDSSGLFYLENTLKPKSKPRIYDSTTSAFLALNAGQVDAVLSDVPIVLDGAKRNDKLQVVAQFKTTEQYGAVLPKGSSNTPILSQAIEQLRKKGLLDQLYKKYFAEQSQIPTVQ